MRQGCPLSALLYAICAEPLATLIKRDQGVTGIGLPYGGVCVINQYADDTTFTVRDGGSVRRVLELVEQYGQASGAKINKDKSEIMYVGEVEREEVGLRVEERYIKVLGVHLGVASKEARDVTWTGVINKIRTVCASWRGRKLKLKGKVIIVNSLLLSVCVYVMTVLDMPDWVMNALNEVVCDFIWEGKGVKIAKHTLVGKWWEGGLNLVDLEAKRSAIRIKTVKKYMVGRWNYGWKEIFKKYVDDVGGMGDNAWYMGFKQSMTVGIPEIYREVLEAWRRFLPKVEYKCEELNVFVNLPLFLNEKFKQNLKTLYEPTFFAGGLRQVKDIIYEVIPGFLREECIYDAVCGMDGMDNRGKVSEMYSKIKASIPLEWSTLLGTECVVNREECMPVMYVREGEEECTMNSMSVKKVYGWLIEDVFKEPAAVKVWNRVFPELGVKKIWTNLNIKYNTIECENNDFLMRHNRLYTNVVLHAINNEVNILCDVCNDGHESFLHYFLDCVDLVDFFVFIKALLVEHWSWGFDLEDGWRPLFLFGVFAKSKKANLCLINFVLSHARYAVVLRRNFAHFEGRKVKIKPLFKSLMKRSIGLLWTYGGVGVKYFFVNGNTLISEGEGGKMVFNW